MREHRYIFPPRRSSSLLPISRNVGGSTTCAWDVGGRVGEGGGEATLPRLVSIYSGFPRFPRLCRARAGTISFARLHNIVFISSCNLVHASSSTPIDPLPLTRLASHAVLLTRTRAASGGRGGLRLVAGFRANSVVYASPKWAIRVTRKSTTMPYLPRHFLSHPSTHSFSVVS